VFQIPLEPFQNRDIDLAGCRCGVGFDLYVPQGMRPVPKILVVEVVVDVGIVAVVLSYFLRVADPVAVAQLRVDVVVVVVLSGGAAGADAGELLLSDCLRLTLEAGGAGRSGGMFFSGATQLFLHLINL
jgi:hypothetical protein